MRRALFLRPQHRTQPLNAFPQTRTERNEEEEEEEGEEEEEEGGRPATCTMACAIRPDTPQARGLRAGGRPAHSDYCVIRCVERRFRAIPTTGAEGREQYPDGFEGVNFGFVRVRVLASQHSTVRTILPVGCTTRLNPKARFRKK